MKKVAITGFHYGNYGDDAMMLQVAAEVRGAGYHPTIIGLPRHLAKRYDVDSAASIVSLLDGASVCMLVSGGVLTHFDMPYFSADLGLLAEHSEKQGCPIHAVSIGGQGESVDFCEGRTKLFGSRQFRSATVRLDSDAPVLRQYTDNVEVFPDMVLSIAALWPKRNECFADGRMHIGFNSSQDLPCTGREIEELLDQEPDLVLHIINNISASNTYCRSDFMPALSHSRALLHPYTDPAETMAVISSLDVMVTHKLHFGVTALAYGVPFVSYGGSRKVREFMSELDLMHLYLGGDIETASLHDLITAARTHSADPSATAPRLERARRLSRRHLAAVREALEKLA